MWIAPNSTIHLLSGINWSPAYTDTVYFGNKTVQLNYMKHKIFRSFDNQSYQRHSKNVLRILATADSLYECNYLMFQNEKRSGQNGDKWFYAFILDIEYVNENTTDVYYEIDVIQTWFWDLKLGQCYVEREIPRTDYIYDNLVPENLECGGYEVGAYIPVDLGEPWYLVQASTDHNGTPAFNYCNGMTSSVINMLCPVEDSSTVPSESALWNMIKDYMTPELLSQNNPENIINITIIPRKLAESNFYDSAHPKGKILREDIDVPTIGFMNFHGYKPKNKKLFSYPYTYLQISNNAGQVAEYKLEDFKTTDPTHLDAYITFRLVGSINGLPSIALIPIDYRGVYEPMFDIDSAIVMTNFPTAPWVTDTFRAYLAQNKASIATSVLTSVVGAAVSIGTGNMLAGVAIDKAEEMENAWTGKSKAANRGKIVAEYQALNAEVGQKASTARTLTSAGSSIASTLAKMTDMASAPKTVSGLTNADMLLTLIGRQRFDIYNVSIKPEMAKIIDDYFSAYGYAQHKFKKPEIMGRTYWGYTKTKGCELIGSCPEGIKAQIAAIFDNGIRFWNSNEIIGDYSLDNSRPRAESEGN